MLVKKTANLKLLLTQLSPWITGKNLVQSNLNSTIECIAGSEGLAWFRETDQVFTSSLEHLNLGHIVLFRAKWLFLHKQIRLFY